MKSIVLFFLLFASVIVYPQDETLPQAIGTAFKAKYPEARLDNWIVRDQLYYVDFTLKNGSYTSAFKEDGMWIETSEVISDYDIPAPLQNYISKNYPSGNISYCERVEAPGSSGFIRVNLYNNTENYVIQSDSNGANIKVSKEETE